MPPHRLRSKTACNLQVDNKVHTVTRPAMATSAARRALINDRPT